ncbi:RNA polymerase sigma-70 factor, ECF subfamily [Natronincola peptidivorans]|uniref:RNA polymerase sigma-70 factor, ECF subfamily n=1 Tax=Natronincola peptidivorans TaxID=426128 RepID=A0A1I0GYI1_9FIRM|nr:RNA polymerase sigma factor [Natronincola peptidivorans]SET76472.1 RNA polymerase sigma-70 factor, ECF subfamily [Natronincola peptidivorans]
MNQQEELMTQQLKDKNSLSYQKIIDACGDKLLRLAFIMIGDQQIAEDIVQETFIALYKNIQSFRGESTIDTWLMRVTINKAKNILRRKKIKNIVYKEGIEIQDTAPLPEEYLTSKEKEIRVRNLLFSLPLKYRDVLYLYYYEERKIKEIADILDLTESGVKSRLKRGREHMKELLVEGGVSQ